MANHRVEALDLEIAAKFKALRLREQQSLNTVALALGIKYQSYQAMEAGKVSIRAWTLQRLSRHYGVHVSHFFESDSHGA